MTLSCTKQVKDLLNSGVGDLGRNEFILDSLKNGKKLYNTDIKYLQTMTQKLDDKISSLQTQTKSSKTRISNETTIISDKEIDEILEKQDKLAKKTDMSQEITHKVSLKSKLKKMLVIVNLLPPTNFT